jgi:hypothetical protein
MSSSIGIPRYQGPRRNQPRSVFGTLFGGAVDEPEVERFLAKQEREARREAPIPTRDTYPGEHRCASAASAH